MGYLTIKTLLTANISKPTENSNYSMLESLTVLEVKSIYKTTYNFWYP